MPDSLSPSLGERRYRSGGSAGAKALAWNAVLYRRSDAARSLDEAVRFLRWAIDAGMDKDFLRDTAGGLHTEFCNLSAGMARDLDAEHLAADMANLDLSELNELITKLDALSIAMRKTEAA